MGREIRENLPPCFYVAINIKGSDDEKRSCKHAFAPGLQDLFRLTSPGYT